MAATVSTIQPISQLPRPGQITPQSEMRTDIAVSPTSSPNISFTPATEVSPALAMTDDELACFHAVTFVLQSHKRLAEEDIQYVANYISSFYAHSKERFREDPNAANHLDDEQLIRFLVYANQRDIGKFALTFNEVLDTVILARDEITLKELLLGPREMFVELYNNPYLSSEDRDFLIRLVSREEYAITLLLGQLKKKILSLETIDTSCTNEDLIIQAQRSDKAVNMTVLSNKCYDEVCIQDARILSDDTARAAMSTREKPAETVYTVDKPQSSATPRTYCFDTLELIAAVTDDAPINPKSREPFSDFALKIILQRFHKEIAMYRRYRDIKASSGTTSVSTAPRFARQ